MPQGALLDDGGLARHPALLNILDARLQLRPVLLEELPFLALRGLLRKLLPHLVQVHGKLAAFGSRPLFLGLQRLLQLDDATPQLAAFGIPGSCLCRLRSRRLAEGLLELGHAVQQRRALLAEPLLLCLQRTQLTASGVRLLLQ